MNKTATNKTATNKTATPRIKYGFKMTFPAKPFTITNLTSVGAHPAYITAYMRVRKALRAGEIEVVGEATPKTVRRGAREILYQRVNAKTAVVSTETASAAV